MLDSFRFWPAVDEGLGKVLLLISCSEIMGREEGIGVDPGVGIGVVIVKGEGL